MNRAVGDTGNLEKTKKSMCREGQVSGNVENRGKNNDSPKENTTAQNDEERNSNLKPSLSTN